MATKELCENLERAWPDYYFAGQWMVRLQDFTDDQIREIAMGCNKADPFDMLSRLMKKAETEDVRLHLLGYKDKDEYDIMQNWIEQKRKEREEREQNEQS